MQRRVRADLICAAASRVGQPDASRHGTTAGAGLAAGSILQSRDSPILASSWARLLGVTRRGREPFAGTSVAATAAFLRGRAKLPPALTALARLALALAPDGALEGLGAAGGLCVKLPALSARRPGTLRTRADLSRAIWWPRQKQQSAASRTAPPCRYAPLRGGTPGGFSTYLRISHSSRRMQEKFSPIESQPAVTARSASQV